MTIDDPNEGTTAPTTMLLGLNNNELRPSVASST